MNGQKNPPVKFIEFIVIVQNRYLQVNIKAINFLKPDINLNGWSLVVIGLLMDGILI